jgi:hypothetical protein
MKSILVTFSAFLSCFLVSPVLGYAQTVLTDNTQTNHRLETPASVPQSTNDGSTLMHLSSIASNEFTALSHPRFPNHQVRVKKSNFCDSTVR